MEETANWISYFSIAVLKHHDHGNSQKKGFTGGLQLHSVRVHYSGVEITGRRWLEKHLRAHDLNHEYEAERVH